jgi:hypothetical protein
MRAVCFADFAHTVGWVKRDTRQLLLGSPIVMCLNSLR